MFGKLSLVGLVFLLVSCATGPSPQELEAGAAKFSLDSPPAGKAMVYIYYLHGDGSKELGDVAYSLDASDEFIGKLFYGQYFSFVVDPGKHTIKWRGLDKKATGAPYSDSMDVTFSANTTYVFSQVHGTMFNRYSSDGLSVISSLNPSKSLTHAKFYLSKTQKSQASTSCLALKPVSLMPEACL